MFNFLKKKKQENLESKDDDVIASITYLIKKNDTNAIIDVELWDYDEISVDALAILLNVLGDDRTFIDTVNIIKSSFINADRTDLFMKIFTKIYSQVKNKTIGYYSKELNDQPCVKPSEMMK